MPDLDPISDRATRLSLVTIVTESLLEQRLIDALQRIGVGGFTITDARGDGARGFRRGDVDGGNVRIETIVSPEIASQILEHVEAVYFESYALIVWVTEVGVLRGEKYH